MTQGDAVRGGGGADGGFGTGGGAGADAGDGAGAGARTDAEAKAAGTDAEAKAAGTDAEAKATGTGSAAWVLPIAVGETTRPVLRPLPVSAAGMLREAGAPPRLVAHLRAVHDVAAQIVAWVAGRGIPVDSEAVLFGAATHDIGKALHPAELSGPGSEHEAAGRDLLLRLGIAPELARFAAVHSTSSADSSLDELLVSLADTVWKGKRRTELEDLVVARLAEASGREVWEEFLELDTLLAGIGDGADERLAYQMGYPVEVPAAQK